MQQHTEPFDFSHLTHDERIDLAMALLGSVKETSGITKEQEAELEHRQKLMDAGQMPFSPWEEVKARLLAAIPK